IDGQVLAVRRKLDRVHGEDLAFQLAGGFPGTGVDGFPGGGIAEGVGVLFSIQFELVGLPIGSGLHFAGWELRIGDRGLAEIAPGGVHLPFSGIGETGGSKGGSGRDEIQQRLVCVHELSSFRVIMRHSKVKFKGLLTVASDSVRYPSRQCQILDFAQVVAFWRDGRYCNARGGKKTVDKPWRTVEFQARVKILGPLENWLATASYDAPADVGSGEACATVDQVVLAGRATNQ